MSRHSRIHKITNKHDFKRATNPAEDLYADYRMPKALSKFDNAYDRLFLELRNICAQAANIDACEPQIRHAFLNFLEEMDCPLAIKNFSALLREKSGDKAKRNDGSIGWYHEFIPILTFMTLARMGRNSGGIDMDSLDSYGGLESAITTHLRHDSIEDHTSLKGFKNQQMAILAEICDENSNYDRNEGLAKIQWILTNTNLMTQKVKKLPDGTKEKENVIEYTARMVDRKKGNPVVFMLKQLDIIHNFSTLLGAEKFTAEKRLKRCNEREDMYGGRHGFSDMAIYQWPEFAKGISVLDCMMASLLFPQFRYLANVDLHYKTPSNQPVGLYRFLGKALSVPYPDEQLSPIHESFKRMKASVDQNNDPEKYKRLTNFIDKVIKPSLLDYKSSFPYLFVREHAHASVSNDNKNALAAPANRLP